MSSQFESAPQRGTEQYIREGIRISFCGGGIDGLRGLLGERGFAEDAINEAIIVGGSPPTVEAFLDEAIDAERGYARRMEENLAGLVADQQEIGSGIGFSDRPQFGVPSLVLRQLQDARDGWRRGKTGIVNAFIRARIAERQAEVVKSATDTLMAMPVTGKDQRLPQLSEQALEVVRDLQQFTVCNVLLRQIDQREAEQQKP